MNPSKQQAICDEIESVWPRSRWTRVRVIVGVSGGADSLCLLRGLHQLNQNDPQNLIVAHYNHRMRPESVDDANFVADVAAQLGLQCAARASESTDGSRSEADLRRERYAFFEAAAKQWGARYVAIAHHRDDQVETIMHNIFRGTGAKGLRGMAEFRPLGEDFVLARPLLHVSKSLIEQAIKEWNQPFCNDASNQQSDWKRNWLRNELLPKLKTQFPHVDEALLRLGENIAQLQRAVDQQTQHLIAEAVEAFDHCLQIDCNRVTHLPPAVRVNLLQQCWHEMGWPQVNMTQAHWSRLSNHLACHDHPATSANFHLPGGIVVRKIKVQDRWITQFKRQPDLV